MAVANFVCIRLKEPAEEHHLAFSVTSPQDTMGHVFSDWRGGVYWRRRVKDGRKAENCLQLRHNG